MGKKDCCSRLTHNRRRPTGGNESKKKGKKNREFETHQNGTGGEEGGGVFSEGAGPGNEEKGRERYQEDCALHREKIPSVDKRTPRARKRVHKTAWTKKEQTPQRRHRRKERCGTPKNGKTGVLGVY